MEISIKDGEERTLRLSNEHFAVSAFCNLTIYDGENVLGDIDIDIVELYTAVLAFVEYQKRINDRDEQLARQEHVRRI